MASRVLVFALYSQSETTRNMYPNLAALWLIWPLALFWVSRIWLIAMRGMLLEDPVVFTLRDRVSLVIGAAVALLLVIAATGRRNQQPPKRLLFSDREPREVRTRVKHDGTGFAIVKC